MTEEEQKIARLKERAQKLRAATIGNDNIDWDNWRSDPIASKVIAAEEDYQLAYSIWNLEARTSYRNK